MELVELRLRNFKRFRERDISFSPGLNLLWGSNESGKTTIHEAILCALFGRDRGQIVDHWDGGPCEVVLTFRSNGRTFLVERRFSEGTHRFGAVNGCELSDVTTNQKEIDEAIRDHLGISERSVFENTVSIRQAELSSMAKKDLSAVGQEIQRVLTGTAQVSASQVLRRLRIKQSDIIGSARPRKPREYDQITERLQECAASRAQAVESRRRLKEIEDEVAALESRTTVESERLRILGDLLARHKRWSELKQRHAEVDRQHSMTFATVKRLNGMLEDLKFAQKELLEYADLVEKVDEIADHLAKLANRRTELTERIRELNEAISSLSGQTARTSSAVRVLAAAVVGLGCLVAGVLVSRWLLILTVPSLLIAGWPLFVRLVHRQDEHAHLAQLATSAQEDLMQLEEEQASLLRYVKCTDVEQAWKRIKAYRGLVAQVHELEIAIKATLAGQRIEDWQAQEADLSRELSTLTRELEDEFAGYSPSTEEAEGWRSEHASLQTSVSRSQNRLHELSGELEAERRNLRDLASLEGEMEYLHRRKAELEFLHRAYGEAIGGLQAVVDKVSLEYLPTLSQKASESLQHITCGRYMSLHVTPDWEMTLDCVDRSGVPGPWVSAGTLDQMYFALRLACGDLLSSGRALPLILDDPFVNFDRQRLDEAFVLLQKLAARNQIILMTHDLYTREWATQADVAVEDLSSAS